jgi:hypothetical protein
VNLADDLLQYEYDLARRAYRNTNDYGRIESPLKSANKRRFSLLLVVEHGNDGFCIAIGRKRAENSTLFLEHPESGLSRVRRYILVFVETGCEMSDRMWM